MSAYFRDKEPKEIKSRLSIAMAAAIIALSALTLRLWYLQVLKADHFMELSQNNRIRLVKSPAPRGVIYDRSGMMVVENRPGFDLYLVPEDVSDFPKLKEMLYKLIGIDSFEIDELLEKSKKRPPFQAIKIKEDLAWDEMVKIENYKFEMPGIILDVSPKRLYKYGEATAHLIGYLGEISEKELKSDEYMKGGYSQGDFIGKYGVEKAYEDLLRGTDGAKEIEVDALGRKIKVVNSTTPYPGNNMHMTIDIKAQYAAWLGLKDKVGAAVAIDPRDGRVLAMVSTPGFDANVLSAGITKQKWNEIVTNPFNILNNRAIQGIYPPASTYKPIHAAAALEAGVLTPSTMIYSGPAFRFAGRDYRDWKTEGHGTINFHRAIVESSDTFFYQVGLKMGIDRLSYYTKNFGFGERTGIALANEKKGLVPSSEWKKKAFGVPWYEGETISVSVGQGYMNATPLQLANAYAAIANNGTLYVPRVFDKVVSPDGKEIKSTTPEVLGKLNISEKNLSLVKNALVGVANEEGGTASWLKASNLKIAGKTGTAQVSKLIKRTKNVASITYKLRDHAWFAGYAPYDDPQIAIAVIVEHGGFGSSAAAPVARDIFKAYLNGDVALPGTENEKEAGVTAVSAPQGGASND